MAITMTDTSVVEAIIRMVEDHIDADLTTAAAGRIFNVADPEPMTQAEWVRALGRAAGWDGEVITTPEMPSPGTVDYRHHWVMDSSAIRTELGYEESVRTADWISRTVEWLRANPPDTGTIERIQSSGLSFTEEDKLAARRS